MVGNPSIMKENLTVRTATNSDFKPMSTQDRQKDSESGFEEPLDTSVDDYRCHPLKG